MDELEGVDLIESNGEAVPTTQAAKSIKAIDRTTVHKICSGQVVLTLGTAVKELVENGIDAGATSIEIRLRDHGVSMVEVVDNGKGVEENDFEGLTLKHHTSKIQDFGDLVGVKTFGFRGEALSSLCALSDLMVVTRHESQSVGTKLVYNHNGKLISKTPCPRQVGTTVTLQNLFSTLPVRHKEFQRNIKKEFGKMVQVLNSYCLISTGVRISCTNQSDKGKKSVVLSTNGHPTIKENISSVFGAKQVSSLLEFKQETASDDILSEYGMQCSSEDVKGKTLFTLEGFISSCEHGQGRSASDRQFYFINSRPCDPAKVTKVVNEVYHQYNRYQYPCVVLNIRLKEDDVDINVTPDKRQILVNNEKLLLATIKTSMIRLYGNIPNSFKMQNTSLSNSFSSSQNTPSRPSPSAGSPSSGRISALSQRFGRKSEGSPLSNMSPSQSSSPLSAFSLKRSFSNSSCAEESPSNKQPKLESFLAKCKSDPGENSVKSMKFEEEGNDLHSDSTLLEKDEIVTNGEKNHSNMNGLIKEESEDVEGERTMIKSESIESDEKIVPSDAIDRPREISIKTEDEQMEMLLLRASELVNGDRDEPEESEEIDSTQKSNDFANNNNNEKDSLQTNDRVTQFSSSSKEPGVKNVLSQFSRSASVTSQSCQKAHSATDNFLSNLLAKKSQNKYVKESSLPSANEYRQNAVDVSEPDDEGICDSASFEETWEEDFYEDSVPKEEKTKEIIVCEEYDPSDFTANRKSRAIEFDIEDIRKKLSLTTEEEKPGELVRKFRAKIAPGENTSAEDELRKEISKDMFAKMEILGQFNLGFIIARLGSDLFIIDQHATDEKYNFETLQATCTIQNQRLIAPQQLELTAANETVLLDNLEIFLKNGFEFKIDEEKPMGQRVSLISMPHSKGWEFGRDDIDELIFMLSDAPGVMCRPTRVRAMFASRACRKSIMIGTALTKAQMQKLVCHMGEINQPWNCPHGRPTMRHLINLDMVTAPR
ncbi:mismatch repair endonuclease PMS2-like [Penaeus japonicus]|uniref:mismatch repair endonuclease PMS2-like n=1 Tax=Penaeus japonicus TaxID=27405 RepID=UPI001C70EB9D|nr:mismatch repair endonuclease PMS2-like [Penaeus japonicus]